MAKSIFYERLLNEYMEEGRVDFNATTISGALKLKYKTDSFEQLSKPQLEEVITFLVKDSIAERNAEFLHAIKAKFQSEYEQVITTLDVKEQELIEKILSYQDPKFLTKIMACFSDFGRMDLPTATLVMAETRARKQGYTVNPTIVYATDFEKYLHVLLQQTEISHNLPILERFVIAGQHWYSGEISIDQEGKAKILIIDSLGTNYWMEKVAQNFNNVFPQGTIYGSSIMRQFASKGCSAFALDDVRHLFTINKYLPEGYKDLFDYVQDNVTGVQGNIFSVKLPISFMRTTQSSILFKPKPDKKAISDSYTPQQLDKPIGKEKLIAAEYLESLKKANTFLKQNGDQEKENNRLLRKLEKMRYNVFDYMLRTPIEEVRETMKQFTLETLPEKIAHMTETATTRSPRKH